MVYNYMANQTAQLAYVQGVRTAEVSMTEQATQLKQRLAVAEAQLASKQHGGTGSTKTPRTPRSPRPPTQHEDKRGHDGLSTQMTPDPFFSLSMFFWCLFPF